MKSARKILDTALKALAGISLLAMVLLTCWQVITRYILNNPSTWSEELVSYMFAWSTLFGAALVSGERGHMSIPVIVDRFGPCGRKVFHVFSEVVAFLFSAAILVFGGVQITSLAMGQMTSSLGVAVGVFYVAMPVCGVLIAIYAILNIIDIIRGNTAQENQNKAEKAAEEA